MDKTRELLAVLGMDSDHQFWTIQKYLSSRDAELYDTQEISLADLAFKLRDEAYMCKKSRPKLRKCMRIVTEKAYPLFDDKSLWETWWIAKARPIHWIIAALIAKEQG